jgi:hypothetical protein
MDFQKFLLGFCVVGIGVIGTFMAYSRLATTPVAVIVSNQPTPPAAVAPQSPPATIESNVADILFSHDSSVFSQDGTVQENFSAIRTGNIVQYTEEQLLIVSGARQSQKETMSFEVRADGIFLVGRNGNRLSDAIRFYPTNLSPDQKVTEGDKSYLLEKEKTHHDIQIGPCLTITKTPEGIESVGIFCQRFGKIFDKIGSSIMFAKVTFVEAAMQQPAASRTVAQVQSLDNTKAALQPSGDTTVDGDIAHGMPSVDDKKIRLTGIAEFPKSVGPDQFMVKVATNKNNTWMVLSGTSSRKLNDVIIASRTITNAEMTNGITGPKSISIECVGARDVDTFMSQGARVCVFLGGLAELTESNSNSAVVKPIPVVKKASRTKRYPAGVNGLNEAATLGR